MKLTTIKSLVAVALCAVGLSSFAAEPEAVQLWEGGPYFAQCNVGADTPEDYGILTNHNDAAQVVTAAMGTEWRLPSDAELNMLAGKNVGDKVCSNVWTTCNGVAGRRFFGMTSGYEDKSIFLPAAGCDYGYGRENDGDQGIYWSSWENGYGDARSLCFGEDDAGVDPYDCSLGLSVRAVRADGRQRADTCGVERTRGGCGEGIGL